MQRSHRVLAHLLGAILLFLVPFRLAADEAAPPAERGKLLYRIHCASCHGEGGTGDGPMAELLRVPPPDLTHLTVSHGGSFPRRQITLIIDGRYEVRGHGQREMPVWGLTFQTQETGAEREQEVRARIEELVDYLETIQEDDDSDGP